MDKSLQPKIFEALKGYNAKTFMSDLVAGIIVAIIALPLSIALAIASGVGPNEGLYTAIVAGFIVSLLGGTRIQISGPTAAFSTIVASTVINHGIETLVVSTIVAGIILIVAGFLKLGKYITKIPNTIVIGFTAGVALTIFVGQLKDFCGVTYLDGARPISNIDKLIEFFKCIQTINPLALLIGFITLAIIIVFPKVIKKIPESLIAILVATFIVIILKLNVTKINDLYVISNKPMTFRMPDFILLTNPAVYTTGITIAALTAIESLLACMVSDKMIGDKHHSNAELIAQGVGSIASVLFGGIPATGALARTTANAKNGGKTPVSGMIHAVVLFFILIGLMKYVGLIPMPTVAALLFIVAYNMSQIKTIKEYIKIGNKKDLIILFTCFILTFIFNLVIGIAISLILHLIIYKLLK